MRNLFFRPPFPKRSRLLWLAWLRAVQPLRPACSRTTTCLWLVLVLAALCLRPDLVGVTSLVRSLGLSDASYYCLLHFFPSPALDLDRYAAAKFARSLLAEGHHWVPRVRSNAVAYLPPSL